MYSALAKLLKSLKGFLSVVDDALPQAGKWKTIFDNIDQIAKVAYTYGDDGAKLVKEWMTVGMPLAGMRVPATFEYALHLVRDVPGLPIGRILSEALGLLGSVAGTVTGVVLGSRAAKTPDAEDPDMSAVDPNAPLKEFGHFENGHVEATVGGDNPHYLSKYSDGNMYPRALEPDVVNLIGTKFDDIIRDGGGQANIFDGGDGHDTIYAAGGNDVLVGGTGGDRLYGGDGDDVLSGGRDADHLDGGDGIDWVDYSDAGSAIRVNLNGTGMWGDAEGDTYRDIENVIGSDHADVLVGNDKDNILSGGHGDDALDGGSGDDTLIGGKGQDTLYGGRGDDVLIGGTGNDLICGAEGSDTVDYSESDGGIRIELEMNPDDGSFIVGEGGHASGDQLLEVENIIGSKYADIIHAQRGNVANALAGGSGDDQLYGYDGDDALQGGAGADMLDGGAGEDLANYAGSNAGVHVDLRAGIAAGGHAAGDVLRGIEHLLGSDHDDVLVGNDGINMIGGGTGNDSIDGGIGDDILTGGAGNDTIVGGEGQDMLLGDDGDDILRGGAGDDMIEGGAGADIIDGGAGEDTASYAESDIGVLVSLNGAAYYGHAFGDTLIDIEHVIGSAFDDSLYGDAKRNQLAGGAGNDVIWGYDGDDVLTGGQGADDLVGGNGSDWADYAGSTEGVTIESGSDGRLHGRGGDAEGDRLTGIENILGSDHDDRISGDANANELLGGKGNDVLTGGAGADVLEGGEGIDTASYANAASGVRIELNSGVGYQDEAEGDVFRDIENVVLSQHHDFMFGTDGDNRIEGLAGNDEIYGFGGNDHIDGGEGADYLQGNEGDDVILGGGSDDRLLGDAGNDRLDGGSGWDRLWGGTGNDTFVFQGGWGYDNIQDFVHGEDVIELDAEAWAQLDSALANASHSDGHLTLTFSGGAIVFANTGIGGITHDDFRMAG